MGVLQAIFLGIVQGLTEFLPVSSSGHLVTLPAVLGWQEMGLQFDVALHMGTLAALVIFFFKDWVSMGLAMVGRGPGTQEERQERRRLGLILIAACVPAAVTGVLVDDLAATTFRSPLLVAWNLAVIGLVMLIADRKCQAHRSLSDTRLADGLFIGVAQALALVPGVSRSGITIAAGLFRNLSRADAARFSFLLSVPITLGAGLFKLSHLPSEGLPAEQVLPFIAGVITAGIVGYAVIAFLLEYLRKHDLRVFVYYRWALAAAILVISLVRA